MPIFFRDNKSLRRSLKIGRGLFDWINEAADYSATG